MQHWQLFSQWFAAKSEVFEDCRHLERAHHREKTNAIYVLAPRKDEQRIVFEQ
jgi:hypothetical protein